MAERFSVWEWTLLQRAADKSHGSVSVRAGSIGKRPYGTFQLNAARSMVERGYFEFVSTDYGWTNRRNGATDIWSEHTYKITNKGLDLFAEKPIFPLIENSEGKNDNG
jgi:hypothetical protein